MTPDEALQQALAHHRNQRLREAEPLYRQVLQQRPDDPVALHHLGVLAFQTGASAPALNLIRRSLQLKSNDPRWYLNEAQVLRALKRFDEAVAACQHSLALAPNDADALHDLGVCLEKLDRDVEAMQAYQKAIEIRPTFATAHFNLGVVYEKLSRYTDCIAEFEHAIQLRPDYPLAHTSLATALLRMGEMERGWNEYEWRVALPEFARRRPIPGKPLWDGSPLNGQRLLITAEQGFGDAFLFLRYAPLAARQGGRVILQVDNPLWRVARSLPDIAEVVSSSAPPPPFDVQIPLMSLPRALKTRLNNIPSATPYLFAEPELSHQWAQRLAGDANFKIGLVWAVAPGHPNSNNRTAGLAAFAPLARPGVTFYSLQKEDALNEAASPPPGMNLVNWTADLKDFADTAALMQHLDLIISVDTAVAHLAGAMRRPTWVLIPFMPDFRWFLDRTDTPWYPEMRVWRREQGGQWDFEMMMRELNSILRKEIEPRSDSEDRG